MNAKILRPLVVAAALALTGSSGTPAFADNISPTYHPIAFIDLPAGSTPLTSFDISFVERSSQRYYLADRSNKAVDVFDASSHTFETRLTGSPAFVGNTGNPDTSGPNGVVVVHDRDELWVGDGMSRVQVFDLRTNSWVATIHTGNNATRADEIAYDQKDKLILIANDADTPPFATLIDVQSRTPIATIPFNDATAGLEQPVWDPETQLFYISVPETTTAPGGAVAVIDPLTRSVVRSFPVTSCAPAGLALGPKQHLLLGCGDPGAVQVMDARTGAATTVNGIGGADQVWYNPGDKHYYVAARNNPPPALGVIDAMTDTLIQVVATGPGAHSVAANPINDEIFVPLRPTAAHPLGGIGVYHQ
jgi:hypothetical protein